MNTFRRKAHLLFLVITLNRTRTDNVIMNFEGCLTVHLPREIILNANLMQQGNFINVFLTRHVSGTCAHYQEQQTLSMVFCTDFFDGW